MALELVRDDDGRIGLVMACGNWDCHRQVGCSPESILFVPPLDERHDPDVHIACCTECADRVAHDQGFGDGWHRVSFAIPMAGLIAAGDWLPPFVDGGEYTAMIRELTERVYARWSEADGSTATGDLDGDPAALAAIQTTLAVVVAIDGRENEDHET